jgi:hypothetical protein
MHRSRTQTGRSRCSESFPAVRGEREERRTGSRSRCDNCGHQHGHRRPVLPDRHQQEHEMRQSDQLTKPTISSWRCREPTLLAHRVRLARHRPARTRRRVHHRRLRPVPEERESPPRQRRPRDRRPSPPSRDRQGRADHHRPQPATTSTGITTGVRASTPTTGTYGTVHTSGSRFRQCR